MQIYLIFFLEGHYFLDIQYVVCTCNEYDHVELVLLWVDAVHHEMLVETLPFHIRSANTICLKSIVLFYIVSRYEKNGQESLHTQYWKGFSIKKNKLISTFLLKWEEINRRGGLLCIASLGLIKLKILLMYGKLLEPYLMVKNLNQLFWIKL